MKTLTISEAARDLAALLKQAIAGEEIGIRSDNTIVALHPLPDANGKTEKEQVSPRAALQRLQEEAHVSPTQAESYLREVYAERLAAEKRSA
jgi:antitoxin (DNA-binding transcriptional repressor) of toxin-antitoxin stability system